MASDHGGVTLQRRGGPIGFAHRGARAECRDNTLASFERALQLGARALETDVWLSADGEVVLDHDGWVRDGWRRRGVATVARADLPGHIPTLSELYERCGSDFDLSVDVKAAHGAPALIRMARRRGAAGRLWICSPDQHRLMAWRGIDDAIHLVHSTSLQTVVGGRAPGAGVPQLLAEHARRLYRAGVAALNLHQQSWTLAGVRAVQGEGVAAFAWDAQTETTLARLIGFGVDALYSDDVRLMLGAIAPMSGA